MITPVSRRRCLWYALESFRLRNFQNLGPPDLHRHHDIEALLRGGDTELARESLLDFERRIVTRIKTPTGHFHLSYLRAAAVLTRWEGDTDGTIPRLHEALELAERLGFPGEIW